MLLGNIEVVPEYRTGVGNVDFSFIACVGGKGLRKVCAEFKLAHSDDLKHGLFEQLPAYMRESGATFGAYCVLDFRGDWFDKPKLKKGGNLEVLLNLARIRSRTPALANIRVFVFRLAKPATASKRRG